MDKNVKKCSINNLQNIFVMVSKSINAATICFLTSILCIAQTKLLDCVAPKVTLSSHCFNFQLFANESNCTELYYVIDFVFSFFFS